MGNLLQQGADLLMGPVYGEVSLSKARSAELNTHQTDPLLLDLNGDGIKTTTELQGKQFDHDNNGFAELSAWVDANGGILAIRFIA